MQMKERKVRLCILFPPSSSLLPWNSVRQAESACPAPAGRGRIWHIKSLPSSHSSHVGTAGKSDVRTNPGESERLLVISGQETVFQEHRETAHHCKDGLVHKAQGLLHLLQHEISYDGMAKAFWCFPAATGDMGGCLPSAPKAS